MPDGPLRTIPMAALYDANARQFLVQKYAVAVTPGLTLMAPRALQRGDIRLLLNGLTVPREGFAALPNVRQELNAMAVRRRVRERLYWAKARSALSRTLARRRSADVIARMTGGNVPVHAPTA